MTDLTPRDDIIQGRRKHKLSQKQLGELVGCHAMTIDKIERGQIKWSRYTAAIETELGLNGAQKQESAAKLSLPADTVEVRSRLLPQQVYGKLNLPLLRSEATSPRASEMFITAKPIMLTYRPSGLDSVDDAYALRVGCDCMAPAFEIGDKAFVDPTLPPEPGKDVLLRGSLTEDSQAVIGRLETYSDKDWTVTQWNVDKAGCKKHAFTRHDFPICHRVVGKWSR